MAHIDTTHIIATEDLDPHGTGVIALNSHAYDGILTNDARAHRDRLALALDFLENADAPAEAIAVVAETYHEATEELYEALALDYPKTETTPNFTFANGFNN